MIAGRKFQFRPVLTFCVVIAVAILVSLGNWQLQRLEWKRDLISSIDRMMAEPEYEIKDSRFELPEYHPVAVDGRFLNEGAVSVFGTYEGAPGAFLFAPFAVSDDFIIYVNRGFAPQSAKPDDIALAPKGLVRIEGLLRYSEKLSPPASWFRNAGADANGFWYVRQPRTMAEAADLSVQSVSQYYIDQHAVENTQWPRGGTTRLDFRNKHMEYALTWFGLAGALIGVWLVFSLPKKQ